MKAVESSDHIAQKREGVVRAAAYCRASADIERQQASYEALMEIYEEKITGHPNWILAGIYVERPKPNKRSKRPQFLQLIEDCDNGKIDCILCRSIAVFIRPKREEVRMLRQLRDQGIELIFENDCLDTESEIYEELIIILESFAKEIDYRLSESLKRTKRRNMQSGEQIERMPYGFKRAEDHFEIVPGEAEVIRLIFDLYEHGATPPEIARTLSEKGIPISSGLNNNWRGAYIRELISNEKYVGDYRTQKKYSVGIRQQRTNDGELPSVYHRDHHPAIIQREQFERCNVIMDLRRRSTPGQYPFGDRLRCPYCGHVLRRRFELQKGSYCCEGEGACRGFVIKAALVEKAILKAYENADLNAVMKKAGLRDYSIAIEAEKLLRIKDKYPTFDKVDYWWLDDLVREIRFGKHSYTASELEAMGDGASASDDRTISVEWRCGVVTTVSSGVTTDREDPGRNARELDEFILSHPDRYPQLIEKTQRKNDTKTSGSR